LFPAADIIVVKARGVAAGYDRLDEVLAAMA
jgi:hypothetical protein